MRPNGNVKYKDISETGCFKSVGDLFVQPACIDLGTTTCNPPASKAFYVKMETLGSSFQDSDFH